MDSANSVFIKKDEEPPVYFIPSLFQVSLSEPKEMRLAIKSLFSKTQNMDIYLPAAISLWKSSGFLVLRSENIQLPEDESSGSCILPGRSRQVLSAPFGKSETISACLLLHCW